LSERTVRIQHVIIHAALKDAVDWDLVPCNVADKADPPAGRSKEKAIWSPEQVRAFLNHCAGDRLAAMWRLAAMTVCAGPRSRLYRGRTSTSTVTF
jgi:hypothetical protein